MDKPGISSRQPSALNSNTWEIILDVCNCNITKNPDYFALCLT